jgi:hypothetical protein
LVVVVVEEVVVMVVEVGSQGWEGKVKVKVKGEG